METVDFYTFAQMLIANAVVLATVGIVLIRMGRQIDRFEQFWSSPTGAAIADRRSEEIRQQQLLIRDLELRIESLRKSIDTLATKPLPALAEPRAPIERQLPIENAVRMVRNGATVEDLTRNCGLNIGEARLMKKLHSPAAEATLA
jgi:hypothetical protein